MRIHTTITGHRIEFKSSARVDAFLERLERMLDDPQIAEQQMIGLAYSIENPILDHTLFPSRGAITKTVLEDPAYTVMTDLLFRKRLAQDAVDVDKLARRYSMTVAEAANDRDVHESAIRQAISAKRIASWMKDGRHYLNPKDVRNLKIGRGGLTT